MFSSVENRGVGHQSLAVLMALSRRFWVLKAWGKAGRSLDLVVDRFLLRIDRGRLLPVLSEVFTLVLPWFSPAKMLAIAASKSYFEVPVKVFHSYNNHHLFKYLRNI